MQRENSIRQFGKVTAVFVSNEKEKSRPLPGNPFGCKESFFVPREDLRKDVNNSPPAFPSAPDGNAADQSGGKSFNKTTRRGVLHPRR